MKHIFRNVLVAATLVLALTACGNNANKKKQAARPHDCAHCTEAVCKTQLTVDELMAKAESLVDKEITFEGLCTHICAHSGRKLFLQGKDEATLLRVEGGALGKFDPECPNHNVKVTGILREQRIDENYLKEWEEELKAQAAEAAGTDQTGAEADHEDVGCATEQKAHGQQASTVDARIADYRARIAQNQEKTGKAYLSFFFVEAKSYEIQK